MWVCEKCGTECDENVNVCSSCGSPRPAASPEQKDAAPSRFCPTCTRLLPAGATECAHCAAGPATEEEKPAPSRRKPKTRDEKLRWLQKALRTLAWAAVLVGALRIYHALSASLIFSTGPFSSRSELLDIRYSVIYSSIFEAAFNWVVLMAFAELIGLFMAIEVNTRRPNGRASQQD